VSIVRKGHIPYAPTGIGQYVDELYTIKGFFGDWAHIYRKHNLAHPTSLSNEALIYSGIDSGVITAPDKDDANGAPLSLLVGDGVAISLSQRSALMPFAEKNADFHQIRFYHQGRYTLDTELGSMEVEAGDFVAIPKGLIYRETPAAAGGVILIFEVADPIQLAERLWDQVGFTSLFVDYSRAEVPSPTSAGDGEVNHETRVRVKYRGEYHSMEYDFDPCHDVVGWLGDPILFKLNVWQIPGIGTTSGFLPPPANAVLFSEEKSFFFNVLGPRPMPTSPPPDASYGAPSHLNDYDEVWFNHSAELAPDTNGHLWFFPPTVPHPGLKRPAEYPPNPVRQVREMKLNFDTSSALHWTPEAKEILMPDPQVAVYTSFYGAHVGVVPEAVTRYAKR